MARRCIFCGGKGLTNEDALPKWLSKVVVPPGTRVRIEHSEWKGNDPARLSRWHAAGMDRKVKQVCGTCNHGWMSALEVAARPWLTLMVRGYPLPLSPEAQRIVAAWATKTVFLLRYTRPVHPVHPHHLRWLFTKQEPPPDVWVGLAGYAGEEAANPAVDIVGRLLHVPGPPPSPLNDRNAVFTTLRIYRLVFQVWVWTDPSPQQVSIAYPIRLGDFIVPVWPATGFDRTWPPNAVLDAAGFSRFCNNAA